MHQPKLRTSLITHHCANGKDDILLYAFQFSGALFDITGNHYAGFSFAGSLFLCSGLVFSLLPWVKHFEGTEGEKMPLKEDTSTSEG